MQDSISPEYSICLGSILTEIGGMFRRRKKPQVHLPFRMTSKAVAPFGDAEVDALHIEAYRQVEDEGLVPFLIGEQWGHYANFWHVYYP